MRQVNTRRKANELYSVMDIQLIRIDLAEKELVAARGMIGILRSTVENDFLKLPEDDEELLARAEKEK